MDVIEIDAASNRGINEMRELRESVRFRPARDRYKVFIVDEAHQITSEAFNALLKTLEEPPEWVVFLLCTTESHKIPSTIVSRCQQFSFRSVDFAELVARMEWIMQQEGITADADAVACWRMPAKAACAIRFRRSIRPSPAAAISSKAAEVRALLGMFSLESLGQRHQALWPKAIRKKMFDVVAELEANGRSLQHFARELARYFRNLLVVKITGSETRLVAASPAEQQQLAEAATPFSEEDLTRYLQLSLDLFRDLQSSLQPRLHLEMGLLRHGSGRPIAADRGSLGEPGQRWTPPRTAAAPKPAPPVPQQASAAARYGHSGARRPPLAAARRVARSQADARRRRPGAF